MKNNDLERIITPFENDGGASGYLVGGAIPPLHNTDTEEEETEVAVVIAVIKEHIRKNE
jgi:hypothetical protein